MVAPARRAGDPVELELGTVPGLEPLAAAELVAVLGRRVPVRRLRPGALVIPAAHLPDVGRLRLAGVAYLTRRFPVARPRALLGHQQLAAVVGLAARVVAARPPGGGFRAMRLSAAGAGSPVMTRLAREVAGAVGLPVDLRDGDMVVRVYPVSDGWTVAVRTSPRPLSARDWRVPGFPGALEATVAAALVRLTRPAAGDTFVDLCCGSATIAVERRLAGPAARLVVAADGDPAALAAARRNARVAGAGPLALARLDAGRLGLAAGSVTALAANPPWGHRMGSHHGNRDLYPRLLAEAARVARPGARFALLTHEVRLTQALLAGDARWHVESEHRLALRGHHPRIWTLLRRDRIRPRGSPTSRGRTGPGWR